MKREFELAAAMRKLLNTPVRDEAQIQRAAQFGVKPRQLCHGMLVLMALLDGAENGNMTAIKEICSMLEDSAAAGREVTIIDDIPPE